MDWGAWATQAAPRSSRQSDLVAVLPIVTHTPRSPYVDFYTGERLAMGSTAIGSAPRRESTYAAVATGLPIASTPVASRSPVS
jgi:hypothetical protein